MLFNAGVSSTTLDCFGEFFIGLVQ